MENDIHDTMLVRIRTRRKETIKLLIAEESKGTYMLLVAKSRVKFPFDKDPR